MSLEVPLVTYILPALWSLLLAFNPYSGHTPASTQSSVQPTAVKSVAMGSESARADFSVSFGPHEVPFRVMGVFALPGEEVTIVAGEDASSFELEASSGTLDRQAPNRWSWQAPRSTGPSVLNVRRLSDGASVTLNAFVMVPYREMRNGLINGYRIGSYPRPRNPQREAAPAGFIEVTRETEDMLVAPHFELGQFICKAGAGYPKYVVIQTPLLLRLEHLLETVNRTTGIQASTFQLMSAYRTPLYNRTIGNETKFTRHQYGDAADIIVDAAPKDGQMDDLNHNGRHDKGDAMVLHRLAEETEGDPAGGGREGGLSAYAANHSHGPFVHIDTRGYVARW
jgi:hypothetical protein